MSEQTMHTRWNPPGLARLSYREATYATALQRMKTYLTTRQDILRGLPLPLDIYDARSWAVALLESWSMVIDVLTFYQERIVNEGYLGTAIELRSIIELAAAIGYEMQPDVAASTFLAFTMLDAQNQPSPRYLIPRGVAVQSVPGGNNTAATGVAQVSSTTQLPQIFETSADLLARPAWNAIQPAPLVGMEARSIYPGDTSLRLSGVATGLKSGDALLIIGEGQSGQSRNWLFATLTTVTSNFKAGYTEVAWGKDVVSGEQSPLANPAAFVLQKQVKLYGYTRGGVYYTPLDTPNASPSAIGLPNVAVHTMIRHPSGTLFAGTDSGVFRSSNDGETWEAANSGLLKTKISALTASSDGKLYAGTTTGNVSYSLDGGNNWYMIIRRPALPNNLAAFFTEPNAANTLPKTEIHALATFTQNEKAYLAAAMDSGVYLSEDGGLNWAQPPADVVPRVMALSFVVSPQGIPFVATAIGVYAVAMSSPHAFLFRHQPQTHPLPKLPVRALAVAPDNTLIAANAQGVFRSQDHAQNWEEATRAPTGIEVLLFTAQATLFAAQGDTILLSRDGGATWSVFAQNIPLSDVRVLLAAASGMFIAGTPDSAATEAGWSRFQVQQKSLDLDRAYQGMRKDDWLVLRQDSRAALYMITGVAAKPNDDYRKNREFTRLTVDSGDHLGAFDRSTTVVYTLSQSLPLFNFTPLQGQSIACAPSGADLTSGQRVFVSGRRVRVRLSGHAAQKLTLTSADGARHMSLTAEGAFILTARPASAPNSSSNALLWSLQDMNGNTWQLAASPDTFDYDLAGESDAVVSELVTVLSATSGPTITLTFTAALQNVYDPATVSICANVVEATQGQTVQDEALGSANQRANARSFTLKYSPLTYLPSTNGGTPVSTLSVAVNGVPWQETNTFFGQDSAQRVYVVRRDSQGHTTVIFGDGQQGARLPVGREHITASYRYGSGSTGNVAANSLTTTRTRPFGVQKVTNPLAASGGADAEPPALAQSMAPQLIQTLQRIVSLTDYEAFARVFPGISKAQAKALWYGGMRLVQLTVASDDGAALMTETYNVLRAAINGVTAAPAQSLMIQSYARLDFQVGATVIIAAEHEDDANTIVENVKQRLLSAFSFAQRAFGQPVSSSEMIALIQSVVGVYAVELAFLSTDRTRQYHAVLHASPARVEGQQVQPAQLLLIDASDQGIELQWKGQNA
jgi:hypothetical protein